MRRTMLAKVSISAQGKRTLFEVPTGKRVVVGRSGDCDVPVAETSVSRHHCSVELQDPRLIVTDLGSAHGLVHRQQKVSSCELEVGDKVRIGAAELRFEGLVEDVAQTIAVRRPAPAAAAAEETSVTGQTDPLLGKRLGNYLVLSRLGSGGYSTVYRAEQTQLAREVALKVLRTPDAEEGPEALHAFLREARAAAALADLRLVQVFDFGFDQDLHFLSMELVRGGSLADRIREQGPVPWRELLPILTDAAGALQVAHAANMVHRDVKPANILLTGDGRAKLSDLGLVGEVGRAVGRVGTAAFMSPEQLRAEPVDGRADLYALGCTAFAALTARPPFHGSKKEIVRAQLQQEAPPLPPGAAPAEFEQLLRRMLAKRADDRPADASQVLAVLERLARQDAAPVRARRAPRRRAGGGGGGNGGMILFSILALAAMALAVWYVKFR
ncbi:MAG: FHA domain-containing serine/threonine-protein kinase [Planctomycetota bacterium]